MFEHTEIGPLKTYVRKGSSQAPCYVMLHGFGSSPEDLLEPISYSPIVNQDLTIIIPKGIKSLPIREFGEDAYAWFDINFVPSGNSVSVVLPKEVPSVIATLQTFFEELSIPLDKVIFGGFSQGGMLAAEFASSGTQSGLMGIVMCSSTILHKETFLKRTFTPCPFLMTHASDDPFFSLELAKSNYKCLESKGCHGKLFEFSGGHEIPGAVWAEISHFVQKCSQKPTDL